MLQILAALRSRPTCGRSRKACIGAALASALLLVCPTFLGAGQGLLSDGTGLGTVWSEAGQTAIVPIFVVDGSGNDLGAGAGSGQRIQGMSIGATLSDPSLVTSVSFSRAGVTSGLTPIFETMLADAGGSTYSWVLTFDETSDPIPFNADLGDLVGHLNLGISPTASPGDRVDVALVAGATALANQGGWLTETGADSLLLEDGVVQVEEAPLFADGFESGNTVAWSSVVP